MTDREPLEPPLNPPDPQPYPNVEEWFYSAGIPVEVEYMGLTLYIKGDIDAVDMGAALVRWEAARSRDAIEGRALCAYATSLGEPGDRIFEAIAAGGEIGCNWDFAELLPKSEVAAIRELAIETARKSGQWRG